MISVLLQKECLWHEERATHPGNQEQVIIKKTLKGRYVISNKNTNNKLTHIFMTRYYNVLYGYEDYQDIGFEAEYR